MVHPGGSARKKHFKLAAAPTRACDWLTDGTPDWCSCQSRCIKSITPLWQTDGNLFFKQMSKHTHACTHIVFCKVTIIFLSLLLLHDARPCDHGAMAGRSLDKSSDLSQGWRQIGIVSHPDLQCNHRVQRAEGEHANPAQKDLARNQTQVFLAVSTAHRCGFPWCFSLTLPAWYYASDYSAALFSLFLPLLLLCISSHQSGLEKSQVYCFSCHVKAAWPGSETQRLRVPIHPSIPCVSRLNRVFQQRCQLRLWDPMLLPGQMRSVIPTASPGSTARPLHSWTCLEHL